MFVPFFRMYVMHGGFRDGRAGFVYAVFASLYKFMTVAKLWEIAAEKRGKRD